LFAIKGILRKILCVFNNTDIQAIYSKFIEKTFTYIFGHNMKIGIEYE